MIDRNHEEIRELLGAYALDAVSEDEAVGVLHHLATCEKCASEVAAHHEIAAMLANTGGDAPTHVWERIAARLGTNTVDWEAGAVVDISEVRKVRSQSERARARHPQAAQWLGAAAVLIVLGLIASVVILQGKVSQLQGESPQQMVVKAAQRALQDPNSNKIGLISTSDSRLAEIAILPGGSAFLINDALPTLPSTRTYQLWGKVGGRLVSLGLLGSHPAVIAFDVGTRGAIASFAVTDEHAGGVVQSSQPPVAVSDT